MKIRLLTIGATLLVALTGCAGTGANRPDVDADGMANPEVALVRSIERVGRAMTDLRATRAGGRDIVPSELQRPIVWRYSGPLDEAAQALAERAGYSFAPPGVDGPSMPKVTVEANGTSIVDVLRSIGAQAGDRATLVVDTADRIITVRRHV